MPFPVALLAGMTMLAGGCGNTDSGVEAVRVAERYMTVRDEADNIDSVAVWHGFGGRHWLIATAKSTHLLVVYDAVTGERLDRVGAPGAAPGQFQRPNGIAVEGDLVFVIERDNARVQILRLPDFTPLGSIGDGQLERPYGGWVHALSEREYLLYVTDNYVTPDDGIPPVAELDRRIHRYTVSVNGDSVTSRLDTAFGETAGDGVLYKVESIFGDAELNRLLVADELETENNLKVYDLAGQFTGTVIGDGIFLYEPEGIALYACQDGTGYWFTTDQSNRRNLFHVFDRESLDFLTTFEGEATMNTDGVWLTRTPMPGFPQGAFYAVHDDGSAAAFDLGEILARTELQACRGT